MRRAAAVALLVLAAGPARAASTDYRVDSHDWNGLSRLADEAREAGCAVEATDALDWSTLGGHDALWLVYPRTAVDPSALRRYLEAGGRVLLADDFGAADAALGGLQIRRLRGALDGADRYQDNPQLPIARQTLTTELSAGVPAVVANHPAFFSASTPATYQFVPGAALVVEGRLGKGYFVALSDPSVLINNMLELEDNLAFARALVHRTCKSGERIVLVTQSFVARGEPSADVTGSDPGEGIFVRFNRMLSGIDDATQAAAVDPRVLATVATLAAVLLLVLGLRAWPARQRIDGEWTRAPAAPDAGWQAMLDRYARIERSGALAPARSWALPAAMLRDEVVTRLSETLGAPVADWPPAKLGQALGRSHGAQAAAAGQELWRRLGRMGWRVSAHKPLELPWVSRGQLVRLHELAQTLFDAVRAQGQGND